MRRILVLALITSAVLPGLGQQVIPDFSAKPSVKWKYKIQRPIYASPVVDENRVFFGGLDSTFYALDAATGKEIWRMKTAGAIRSNAVIHAGILYLNGGDGKLYALDKTSGKRNWIFSGKGEKKYDFADYHHSTPVFANNVLYFGSGDGNIYAINAANGAKIWSYQTGDAVHATPAIAGDKIFFGSFDGYVYALNLSDGQLAWKFKTVGQMYFPKGEVQGSPAVYKGIVVIGARDFNVYAISQSKGTGLWNRYLPNGWGLVNTIRDSTLYIGTGDQRMFYAIDPRNGRENWSKKMELLVFGSSAFSKSMLYTGTTMGKLHGIDLKTGDTRWTFTTEAYEKNHLKYFKADDTYRDDIYSIIKSNEQFLEAQNELGGIFSTPAITDELMVITTTDGTVYCLRR